MAIFQAKKATAFLDSVGVNIHVNYPQYSNLAAVKAALLDIGIKHVRDGGSPSIAAKLQTLGASGIKTLMLVDPRWSGTVPNNNYAISRIDSSGNCVVDTTRTKYTVNQLVAAVGAANLSGLEAPNEIDFNAPGLKWSQADPVTVSQDRNSAYSWIKYMDKFVRDTKVALANDPACAGLSNVGGGLGGTYTYDNINPSLPCGDAIDFGNGHYYENGGNGFNDKAGYIGIAKYYATTSFPGNWLNRDLSKALGGEDGNSDVARYAYERPYLPKPMYITEMGWHTGSSKDSVNYTIHAKYLARTFVEYFRLGFPRSYWYEFVNKGSNVDGVGDREDSFGLLHTDLTYKPGVVQLKKLLSILADASDTRPTAGTLEYVLNKTMPTGYTKSNLVKEVLLQKSNGTFVLMVYHNIANAINVGVSGRATPKTHPDVPAQLSFNGRYNIKNTTLRSDAVVPSTTVINNIQTYNFNVNDTVTILEISPVV